FPTRIETKVGGTSGILRATSETITPELFRGVPELAAPTGEANRIYRVEQLSDVTTEFEMPLTEGTLANPWTAEEKRSKHVLVWHDDFGNEAMRSEATKWRDRPG